MAQPRKHGRDHLPSGYAAVVQQVADPDDLLPEGSADQLRTVLGTSSGAIAVGYFTRTATLTQAAGDTVNWSSVNEDMATSADYFALNAGSDIQIKQPGVYAFDLRITSIGTSFTSGALVTLLLNVDVDSGSVGFWSSANASGSDEAVLTQAVQIQDATVADVFNEPTPVTGYAAWLSTDTFPVTISTFIQWAEDAVGRQISTALRFTWVRLGDADT